MRLVACCAGAVALLAGTSTARAVEPTGVVETYADVALAMYEDALGTAEEFEAAVDSFLAEPSDEGFEAAKEAWLAARVPYQQTEAYRFGNPVVDGWEGKVNAWPLDEGLIDYVDTEAYGSESPENAFYTANVVANERLQVGGETLDASTIDASLLSELHEAGEIEANVSRGYHAAEFLLWGQDLNGTGPGAGDRPWTDYAQGDGCTNDHCGRRAEYLAVVSDLLVSDLEEMVGYWQDGGEAREGVTGDPGQGLTALLTGLGSLSYGELAGERMQLGLLLGDPEEEHDCFSDNTHNSHYYNQVGMSAIARGSYERADGSTVEGPSLLGLLEAQAPEAAEELDAALKATSEAMTAMKERAENVEAYDRMIGSGNEEGNAVVQAVIDRLKEQARAVETAVAALNLAPIEVEGSDSLDDPDAVFFN